MFHKKILHAKIDIFSIQGDMKRYRVKKSSLTDLPAGSEEFLIRFFHTIKTSARLQRTKPISDLDPCRIRLELDKYNIHIVSKIERAS